MAERKTVWFITGASSGFGRALAEAVLNRGDRAVLAARRIEALADLAAAFPDAAQPVQLDVTDAAQRRAALDAAHARFGGIDVLANIAGRGSLGAAEEFSDKQLREQMEVNFFAAAALTREVLPAMRVRHSGHILMLTSIGGLASVGGFSVYCASKFALEGWSEALRDEVGPLGIKVTIVEPGAFRTDFAGSANMRPEQMIEDYRPVVEPIEAYLYGNDGKQPGDPKKAADLMMAAVDNPSPPLRLMMGADAFGLWEKKQAAMQAEFAQWREAGEATAYEDAVLMPVGG